MRISQIRYPAMRDAAVSNESRTIVVVLELDRRETILLKAYFESHFESQNERVSSFGDDLRSIMGLVGIVHEMAKPNIYEFVFTPELRTQLDIRNTDVAERQVLAAVAKCLRRYKESL